MSNIGRKQRNETAALTYGKDSYVNSFQVLQGRPHADKALPLLQKIASLVKPIMRSHGWRLPLLSEFVPDDPSLVGLNVNGGQQILLRLRPRWAPNTFYSDGELVGVMLHELTHNVHGPHDDKFYKYLAGLEREYEELQRSGYAGEGFFAPGKRLGEGWSHNLPMTEARRRALEAAERRAKALGGGADRLGGKGWTTKKLIMTPGQLAAEAAERRLHDGKACGRDKQAEVEADKAARDGARHTAIDLPEVGPHEIIVIDSDSGSDSEVEVISTTGAAADRSSLNPDKNGDNATKNNRKRQKLSRTDPPGGEIEHPLPHTSPQRRYPRGPSSSSSIHSSPVHPISEPEPEFMEWACATCTYVNHPQRVACEMCSSNKPPRAGAVSAAPVASRPPIRKTAPPRQDFGLEQDVQEETWDCLTCGEHGMPYEFWTCRFCGQVKASS